MKRLLRLVRDWLAEWDAEQRAALELAPDEVWHTLPLHASVPCAGEPSSTGRVPGYMTRWRPWCGPVRAAVRAWYADAQAAADRAIGPQLAALAASWRLT